MVGTAEKNVGLARSTVPQKVAASKRPAMKVQRQHQQAAGVVVHVEPGHDALRRRADVGVVQHDAFGPAGRAAGVDQQGQRAGRSGHRGRLAGRDG